MRPLLQVPGQEMMMFQPRIVAVKKGGHVSDVAEIGTDSDGHYWSKVCFRYTGHLRSPVICGGI